MSNEDNIIDQAKKAAEEASETIGDAVDEASDTVSDAVSDAADAAGDAMNEAQETVAQTVSEAADEASQAVEEAGDAVEEASQTAADSIAKAVDQAAPAQTEGSELDALVEKLQAAMPASLADSQYSPAGLLTLLQEYFPKLPADLQSRILNLFQGMDPKDLTSIETWKSVVTMVLYSAKNQVEQVTDLVDSVLPDPLKSSNLLGMFQGAVDKFTPGVVKGAASGAKDMAANLGSMASNLEGMSAEDLVDPETWKGLYYMLDMGLRTQVTLLKERMTGGGEGEEEGDDNFDDWDDWDE